MLQRGSNSDGPSILLMVVIRFVGPAVVIDEGCRFVDQGCNRGDHTSVRRRFGRQVRSVGWRGICLRRLLCSGSSIESGFQSCSVNDRLKNRSGLPKCLNNTIQLARSIIASADHRFDLAGVWIQSDQRSLWSRQTVCGLLPLVPRSDLFIGEIQAVVYRFYGDSLQIRIQRRVHTKAAVCDLFFGEGSQQFLANVIHQIWSVAGVDLQRNDFDFRVFGLFALLVGDGAHGAHCGQNQIAPFLYFNGMFDRRKLTIGRRNDSD